MSIYLTEAGMKKIVEGDAPKELLKALGLEQMPTLTKSTKTA